MAVALHRALAQDRDFRVETLVMDDESREELEEYFATLNREEA